MDKLMTAAGVALLDTYFDLQRDSGPQVYAAIGAVESEAWEAGREAAATSAAARAVCDFFDGHGWIDEDLVAALRATLGAPR